MKTGIGNLAWLLAITPWLALSAAQTYKPTEEQKRNANRNMSIGYVSTASWFTE